MFEAVDGLVAEHAELEQRLADAGDPRRPAARQAAQPALRRAVGDRRAPGASGSGSATTSRPPASWPPRTRRSPRRPSALSRAPRGRRGAAAPPAGARATPTDAKDALLEIKSGEGGEESALFAGDLLRMYTRYAERRGWKTEMLDATESDLGGYKSVTVAVKAKGTPEPGRGAVRAAEVRGRRAPRPAGAGHRVARAACTPPPPACW